MSFLNRIPGANGLWRPNRKERLDAQGLPIEDRLRPETRALVEAFAVKRNKYALSMLDPYFVETKSRESRLADAEEVKRLEKNFAQDGDSTLTKALEYTMYTRINESNLLGDMHAELTTKADDLRNGIDLYIEKIDAKTSTPFGLSVDVTFSRDAITIREKIQDIRYKLLSGGRLAQLSYYKPLRITPETKASPITYLPKVVIALDRERAVQSLEDLAQAQKEGTVGETSTSDTRSVMLYQIKEQLKAYLWYSQTKVDKKTAPRVVETIGRYEQALGDVEQLITSLRLDYKEMSDLATESEATQILMEQLSDELGYSPSAQK